MVTQRFVTDRLLPTGVGISRDQGGYYDLSATGSGNGEMWKYKQENDDLPLDDFDRSLLAERSLNPLLTATQRHAFTPWPRPRATHALSAAQQEPDTWQRQHPTFDLPKSDPFLSPSAPMAKEEFLVNADLQMTQKTRSGCSYGEELDVMIPTSNFVTEDRGYVSACTLLSNTPIIQGIPLIATTQLPDQVRSLFNFPLFNAMQSKCFQCAYNTDNNLVVSAPTGSGKTVIMELAICRLMELLKTGSIKVVYQAPTKSLCGERHREWQMKFGSFDIQCAELTGDTDFNSLRNVANASIIITTPEKWDSVTRKWKDNAKLMEMIRLFLVDEVHILKENRGATLEAIVSRMKSVGSKVRFIALSATIPNSEDIATWLTRNSDTPHEPAVREVFGESFRPVKLQKYVKGYPGSTNMFGFENSLTAKIPEIVKQYSKGKPVMVFCTTKESAARTANVLASVWQESNLRSPPWKTPKNPIVVEEERLKKIVASGVAFHHGGLSSSDRHIVENAFRNGDISIICSTSTLAVGVNLPCYLVILKGTVGYTDGGLQEYSCLDVMQMLGRAGRPQFETEACAVIMCHINHRARYEKMVSGEEILESSLHRNLIEHLNAEIGVGTIHDRNSAKNWLAGTFLNVRLQKNPDYYRLHENTETQDESNTLMQLCEKDLQMLEQSKLIQCSPQLSCTELGDAMARYYIKYNTMKSFIAMPAKARLIQVLQTLTSAVEFGELRIRVGEKSFLKELNKSKDIQFPIDVDIATFQQKVSLLIQAKLGGVNFDHLRKGKNGLTSGQFRQLLTDTLVALGHSKRLIRCLVDIQLYRDDAVSAMNALELGRGIAAGVWENSPMQMKQIPGLGDVSVRKLASVGIKTIESLANTPPQRFEVVLSKSTPFGADLSQKIAKFPTLRVSAKEVSRFNTNGKGMELRLHCEIGFMNQTVPLRYNSQQYSVLFLTATSDGHIVDFRRFSPVKLQQSEEILLTVHVEQLITHVDCHVMCDDLAGTHRCVELQLDLPTYYFPAADRILSMSNRPEPIQPTSRKTCLEEFDNDGLDDSDLLAVASGPDPKEAVQDIDEILGGFDYGHNSKITTKRKTREAVHTKNEALPGALGYHSPQKLSNGRWTCQHLCNSKGIDCKHKCCNDGVERPKKRPKNTSNTSKLAFKQEKGTKTEATVFKRSTEQCPPVKQLTTHFQSHESRQNSVLSSYSSISENKNSQRGETSQIKMLNTYLAAEHELQCIPHAIKNRSAQHTTYRTACDMVEDRSSYDTSQYGSGFDNAAPKLAEQSSDAIHEPNVSSAFNPKVCDVEHSETAAAPTKQCPEEIFTDLSDFEDTELASLDSIIAGTNVSGNHGDGDNVNAKISNLNTANLHDMSSQAFYCLETPAQVTFDSELKHQTKETEEQREKRIYEEDQKKKWADIGSTIFTYENSGSCIEII